MEFRVLGPLEVLDDGREVDLGAPKQRALLAILLLHANEVVSTDRLVDDLWEDEPPETARKALQVYVSQLRKLLGRERLHTRDRGYMLTVADGELDLDRFRGLVAAGDPVGALGLWRGEPLQGFADRGFAAPDIARLEELRLTAIEERNEQQLAAGDHVELVGELESLVRAHPLRERLRGQQMLALYRSGRQAEALEAYQDARRTLTDELGIEPGRELRDLQQQILNQDPALDPPPAALVAVEAGALGEGERRRGRLGVLFAAVMLLAGVTIVIAIVVGTRGSSGSGVVVRPNSVALIDPRTNSVIDDISVGKSPSSVAVGEGAVWVLNGDDRTVSRVDLTTRSVRTLSIGGNPTDLTVGNGALWVVNGFARTVLRVDPDTGTIERTVRLPRVQHGGSSRSSIGSTGRAVWVSTRGFAEPASSGLWRIDPRSNRIDATYPGLGGDVATSRSAVWIAGATLTSIDPRSGSPQTAWAFVPPDDFRQVSTGAGAVWVTGSLNGTLTKLGSFGQDLERTITVGTSPAGVATGAGSVWVANTGDGTVVRVNPLSVRITKTISVGGSPGGVAVSPEGIWVTVT